MLEKNPDNLKIVYKNFPLRSHAMSLPAAHSALAAQQQGRFWDFHDKLFSYITSPSKKKLDNDELSKIPTELGLDMPRFLESIKDPAIDKKIQQDLMEGVKAGVTGTPTIFINGHRVKNRSLQAIQEMIDQEVSKSKKAK